MSTAEIRTHLKTKLPSHMLPASISKRDSLPLLPNGKLDRQTLASLNEIAIKPSVSGAMPKPTARSPLEYRLVSIWREVLRQPTIGIHDDFFELGGHSLMALRLMSKVEAFSGIRLPLSLLTQAPTVAQLAAVLERKGWHTSWTSLVPIKPSGNKTPFFHVGAYQESILNFAGLGRHFDSDRPLYGIQPQGVDGDEPVHASISEMAAHYICEIKSVQPEGPYLIGGHCAGGWVAYEMVCQLQEAGDKIGFFGVVDSPPPHLFPPSAASVGNAASRMRYYLGERRLWNAIAWQYQLKVQSRYAYSHGDAHAKQIAHVRRAYETAMERYREDLNDLGRAKFDGLVHKFRSSEYANFAQKDWHMRWSELVSGDVVPHWVESTHATLLHEPQVQQLAVEISESLDSVR